MTIIRKWTMIIMMAAGLGLAVMGCNQGPAEEAGEEIDETVEEGAEEMEEAGEEAKESVN